MHNRMPEHHFSPPPHHQLTTAGDDLLSSPLLSSSVHGSFCFSPTLRQYVLSSSGTVSYLVQSCDRLPSTLHNPSRQYVLSVLTADMERQYVLSGLISFCPRMTELEAFASGLLQRVQLGQACVARQYVLSISAISRISTVTPFSEKQDHFKHFLAPLARQYVLSALVSGQESQYVLSAMALSQSVRSASDGLPTQFNLFELHCITCQDLTSRQYVLSKQPALMLRQYVLSSLTQLINGTPPGSPPGNLPARLKRRKPSGTHPKPPSPRGFLLPDQKTIFARLGPLGPGGRSHYGVSK